MITTKTIDLISSGIEQGSIGSSGDVDNPARVRTIGYIDIDILKLDAETAILSITSSVSGKTPQVDFMGYDNNKTLLCDLYWYNSPYSVNLKSYNGIRYIRAVFKYSNNSTLSASEITSASLSVSGISKEWYLDSDGKLMNTELPEPIEDVFSVPHPASFWRLDSNDILTLNGKDWSPFPEPMNYLTPPYPATMWYLDEDNKLKNVLLPDILPMGAFALTTELQEIRLPESLEEIGPEAFYGSAIRRVTIPNNLCTYYATSFPPGCVVTGGHLIE